MHNSLRAPTEGSRLSPVSVFEFVFCGLLWLCLCPPLLLGCRREFHKEGGGWWAATSPEHWSVQRVRGWLASGHTAVGLLWTAEHREPGEKTPHHKVDRLGAAVCSFKRVCSYICGWGYLSQSLCMRVTVHVRAQWGRVHVYSCICWCIMHDKKTISKAALALIWPDCCFCLGHPD